MAATDATCRPMRDTDAPRVAVLAGELGYPSTPEQILARKAELDRLGATLLAVAETPQGGVVGWIMVTVMTSIEADPYGEIRGLVVGEGARSRGVGAALTAMGEAWARDRGLREMVVRSNVIRERAHAFYQRLGYVEKKRQSNLRKPLL